MPGNQPKYITAPSLRVPHCFGLPSPPVPFPGVQFPNSELRPGAL